MNELNWQDEWAAVLDPFSKRLESEKSVQKFDLTKDAVISLSNGDKFRLISGNEITLSVTFFIAVKDDGVTVPDTIILPYRSLVSIQIT